MKKLSKIFLTMSGLLVLAFLISFAFFNPKSWPGVALTINEPPQKSDYIVILMGNVLTRTPVAAQLFHSGMSDQIIFSKVIPSDEVITRLYKGDAEVTVDLLQKSGVPTSAIVLLETNPVGSTFDEANLILDHITKVKPNATSITIVTDWFHSRRAAWIFNKVNDNRFKIHMVSAMKDPKTPENWYLEEETFIPVITEYIKWLYYLLNY